MLCCLFLDLGEYIQAQTNQTWCLGALGCFITLLLQQIHPEIEPNVNSYLNTHIF